MSTLQQQTKDAAATIRHLIDAYDAAHGDNAEQLRKRGNMMRGWVGTLNSWRDDMREAVCAAVDEDAPRWCVFMDGGYCCHHEGPIECGGYGSCPWFKARR